MATATVPTTTIPAGGAASVDDKRVDRLLDYTKFHIGIYLSIGGGVVALFGSRENEYIKALIGNPTMLAVGLAFIAIAGLAGGIVASSCTEAESLNSFWKDSKIGPWQLTMVESWQLKKKGLARFLAGQWATGRQWAYVEHWCFWAGLIAITLAIAASTKGPVVTIPLLSDPL